MNKVDLAKLQREKEEHREAMQKLDDEIKKAEYAAKEAELEPLKALAIKLHSILCPYNHCDACGWGYEQDKGVDNWNGSEHTKWLNHVGNLVKPDKWSKDKPVSIDTINTLLDFVSSIKKVHPDALWLISHRLTP